MGHTVVTSVVTNQLCHCGTKAIKENTQIYGMVVFKHNFTKQAVGWGACGLWFALH